MSYQFRGQRCMTVLCKAVWPTHWSMHGCGLIPSCDQYASNCSCSAALPPDSCSFMCWSRMALQVPFESLHAVCSMFKSSLEPCLHVESVTSAWGKEQPKGTLDHLKCLLKLTGSLKSWPGRLRAALLRAPTLKGWPQAEVSILCLVGVCCSGQQTLL